MLITRKIEIWVAKSSEEEYQAAWNYLRYLDNHIFQAANKIVSHQFFNKALLDRLQLAHPKYIDISDEIRKIDDKLILETRREIRSSLFDQRKKLFLIKNTFDKEIIKQGNEILNTSIENSTYQLISHEYPAINANIRNALNRSVQHLYKEAESEILQGKRALSTYRKGMPIPFQMSKTKFVLGEDGQVYLKWFNKIKFELKFGRDRSQNKVIIDRILSGKYKAKDSSIQFKNKKLFLLLVVEIGESMNKPDRSICLGVDMGLSIPAYAAFNTNVYGFPIGSGKELIRVRTSLQKKRKELQRDLKFNVGGKGYVKKAAALERYEGKERSFVHTHNHIFSREIIKLALKFNAGIIKLESLEGIMENIDNRYLSRNWNYYELQKLIVYKAKVNGIDVQFINPEYTSQICSFCGSQVKGQRLSQSEFQCKNPECSHKDSKGENMVVNADFNGARNIAKSIKVI